MARALLLLARVTMKRALFAVMFVATTSTAASAGTYVGLGIGSSPAISEQTDRLEGDGRSGRFLVGMRFARVSIEGSVGGYDVALINANSGMFVPHGTSYQVAGAVKLSLPIGNKFEGFGRAGLHKTWIRADVMPDINNMSGGGYLLGLGLEYRLNMIIGQGSIFVDYQYNQAKLEGERFTFDGSSRMFTLGVTVGL